jgi:TetR/AcrR family transcriptional repressor of nem operon
MRYSKEHKQNSREKILAAATALFAGQGVKATSIDQIMAAAGLTRGAFYAHFRSKDQLIIETMGANLGLVCWLSERSVADPDKLLSAALDSFRTYLDPSRRDKVGKTCLLTSMADEAIKGSKALRRAYASRLQLVIKELERSFPEGDEQAQCKAVLCAVLAVGGLILSRAVEPPDFSDLIESHCLEEIQALLSGNT